MANERALLLWLILSLVYVVTGGKARKKKKSVFNLSPPFNTLQ